MPGILLILTNIGIIIIILCGAFFGEEVVITIFTLGLYWLSGEAFEDNYLEEHWYVVVMLLLAHMLINSILSYIYIKKVNLSANKKIYMTLFPEITFMILKSEIVSKVNTVDIERIPEMIIFDHGHTLLYEPNFNMHNANKEIYKYISKNPRNISFEQFDTDVNNMFDDIKRKNGNNIEIDECSILKTIYKYMDIELSISFEEAERIIWDGLSKGAIMPYADVMINYLNSVGIRTAVISNIVFSSNALKERLDKLLPNNKFEFVLTSSEYILKKPNLLMFEEAMNKARLKADKIWYCGDNIAKDVCGAHNVGMFPVFYERQQDKYVPNHKRRKIKYELGFKYMHIHDLREIIDALENIKEK